MTPPSPNIFYHFFSISISPVKLRRSIENTGLSVSTVREPSSVHMPSKRVSLSSTFIKPSTVIECERKSLFASSSGSPAGEPSRIEFNYFVSCFLRARIYGLLDDTTAPHSPYEKNTW